MGVVQAVKDVSENARVIALAGQVADDASQLYDVGFDAIFSIVPRTMTVPEAIETAYENLANTAENIARLLA